MIVPVVDKVRDVNGKVIGFRDKATGQPYRMYPSGTSKTRKDLLLSKTKPLARFLIEDTRVSDSELEGQAKAKINQAIRLLQDAAGMLQAEDDRILRFRATDA